MTDERSNEHQSRQYRVQRTDDEWRSELSDEEFAVLRAAATEAPWTGALLDENREGIYRCRACSAELFRSRTKFESHCGWPSFFAPEDAAVELLPDHSLGRERTEVRCAACGSHLGHVFHGEGYDTPTDDRYCMNSIALTFDAAGE